jgi:hypothetical protein
VYPFWDEWKLYHKVTFDGIRKLVIINFNESLIDIREDVYSSWKEWVQLNDNAKFEPAFRAIGGDSIGGSDKAGDIYFTINGWRIYCDHSIDINGVIFSDDFPSPFLVPNDTNIVTNKVSQLVVRTSSGTGGGSDITPSQITSHIDANSFKLAETLDKLTQVLGYVDELETRLSATRTAKLDNLDHKVSEIFDMPMTSEAPVPNSMRDWITRKMLTINKYIGLK